MIMVKTVAKMVAVALVNNRMIADINAAINEADRYGMSEDNPSRRLLNRLLKRHTRIADKMVHYATQLTKENGHAET
ncbi:hypothetical protein SOP91_00165 (plasmid) [Enterobacter hormaechei]|uniref:hypothetical protein n=1 Tax=Enterobacter hormaechei TaxID=158836 RepID=UPI002B4BDB48|nr:hypothetical protein [Enterobacter hormaechei]WRM07124.1 hypothetical protein SOP91_00165 [Enterobacter hormaechei]